MAAEPEQILVDGDIPVILRRSARARRMTLRVARAGGGVVLTLPVSASLSAGLGFAESRADWLREARSKMPVLRPVGHGTLLTVQGSVLRVTPGDVRSLRVEGDALIVPGARDAGPVVAAWLKQLARQRLVAACDHYAAMIDRPYHAITLRDTRSRWGSCTHDGRLMFSWRLAMAPRAVLDYVAAHEVAHLRHMDHSADFWRTTRALMPDYDIHREWLRKHGSDLQAWIFTR